MRTRNVRPTEMKGMRRTQSVWIVKERCKDEEIGTMHDGGGRDAEGTARRSRHKPKCKNSGKNGHTPFQSRCRDCVIGQVLTEYHLKSKETKDHHLQCCAASATKPKR